jgi:hypothetical protein
MLLQWIVQWIVLGLIVLAFFGLAFAFSRKGMTIKPDPENKPPNDLGGSWPK